VFKISHKIYSAFLLPLILLAFESGAFAAVDVKDLKMSADKVDFDYETNMSNFSGNVFIQKNDFTLKADEASISAADKQGKASGNVMVLNGSKVFFCDKIEYDFENKKGTLLDGSTMQNIWIIKGDRVFQEEGEIIRVMNAQIFTCSSLNPHYVMTSKEIVINKNKNKISAKNMVLWIGHVPIFYFPYFSRTLDDSSVFSMEIKQDEIIGLEILTKYKFYSSNHVKARAHLDWYESKGVAVGVDQKALWDTGKEKAFLYYIQDNEFQPIRSEEEAGTLSRYRLTMDHYNKFDSTWNSQLNLNLYSDLDFYDDFFPSEFDEDIQVDNRYKLSKVTEDYAAGAMMRVKLNDFENVLERIPQVYYDVYEFAVGDSDFYFSSFNNAVFLNQNFTGDQTEHSALRFFTGNELSYPAKYFGWLNINPKIMLNGMWYSKSREEEILADASTLEEEGNAIFRAASEFSTSFSTNLYKVFESESRLWGYDRFRHILTPDITYSYRPDPTKDDEEFLQFDEIDALGDESSSLSFGIISRWQAKTNQKLDTILNTRYSILYDLKAEEDPWSSFNIDSQVRIVKNLKVDFNLNYDIKEGEVGSFRTDASWIIEEMIGLSCGYWYRMNDDALISPEISINMGNNIFLRTYGFYNEGTGVFERMEYALVKSMHCMDFALKYSSREFRDEQTIFFTISPKGYTTQGLLIGNDMMSGNY